MQRPIINTKVVDQVLKVYTLKTNDGVNLNETMTAGQMVILEIILNRGVTAEMVGISQEQFEREAGTDKIRKVHIMCHTRFGKSLIIGAGMAIRASNKMEKWANISGTKDQASIIMDYMITIATKDPIIATTLRTSKAIIETERLTQRKSRTHITFRKGGEVKIHTSSATMGFGAKNIVLDEAALVSDDEESKIYRMLGDNPTDYFYCKIGNPFNNNHFRDSYEDDSYYKVDYDLTDGIKMGRLTEDFLIEPRKKPNFDVLYENVFPDQDGEDKHGWRPLIGNKQLKNAMVENGEGFGEVIHGGDPAGGGTNNAVIVERKGNYAEILYSEPGTMPVDFADEMSVTVKRRGAIKVCYDEVGVGKGTRNRMESTKETKRISVPVNAGKSVKSIEDDLPKSERELSKDFVNVRAYIFWQVKIYFDQGGKISNDERWKNLLKVKYRIRNGKVQVISKEDLRKIYKIDDLGESDALSFTFFPGKAKYFEMPHFAGNPDGSDYGGVDPMYPDLGI